MYSSVTDPGAFLREPRDRTVWAACGPPPGKGTRTWISPQPRDPGTNSARAATPSLPRTSPRRQPLAGARRQHGLRGQARATPTSFLIRSAKVVRSPAKLPRRHWSVDHASATRCRCRRHRRRDQRERRRPTMANPPPGPPRVMPNVVAAGPPVVGVSAANPPVPRRSLRRPTRARGRRVSVGAVGVAARRQSSRPVNSWSSAEGANARVSRSAGTSCASRSVMA